MMKHVKRWFKWSKKKTELPLLVDESPPAVQAARPDEVLVEDKVPEESLDALWRKLEDCELQTRPAYARYEHNDLGFISTDLSEATYSTPHEILDMNCQFLDGVLTDFPVWRVYHRLFKLHDREVDCTELVRKGYTTIPSFTTKRGGFMGDPLSFIHLTLQMSATVNMAVYLSAERSQDKHDRPLGQGAGDDQLLVGASNSLYEKLRTSFEATKMTVSKIDSWSPDSMTFCEQYAVKPADFAYLENYAEDSRFGDLIYLDIIKGSILSGKSKVKSVGSIPLIGHSRMLNKQVKWHPIEWVRRRAPAILWSANYQHAVKLSSAMASLPSSLGGIDMALGRVIDFNDELFQKRLPYYEAIEKLPREEFLKYQLLLTGIYHSNPKGRPWENDPRLFEELVPKLQVGSEEDLEKSVSIPLSVARQGHNAVRRYLRNVEGIVSFRDLYGELLRRDAFVKIWHEEDVMSYLTLPASLPKLRASKAWKYIYETVTPVEECSCKSIEEIAHKFDLRTWGIFVSKEDPAIKELFDGMPSLFIDYSEQSI